MKTFTKKYFFFIWKIDNVTYKLFSVSFGRLQLFETRHHISFKTISAEKVSVNIDHVKGFTDKITGYDPRDIYNTNENVFFIGNTARPRFNLNVTCIITCDIMEDFSLKKLTLKT